MHLVIPFAICMCTTLPLLVDPVLRYTGTTISSLCYSNGGSHVLVGTGTGEVKALSLNQEDAVFTLESPQVCMYS